MPDPAAAQATRSVLEHLVLFKMPRLVNDREEEAGVLEALQALEVKFPGVLSLRTGKLVKEQDGFTHAIHVRFPSERSLIDYYCSEQLEEVIQIMLPVLCGENTVDYVDFLKDEADTGQGNTVLVHVCFIQVKQGVAHEMVEDVLSSLRGLAAEMPSMVLQATAGPNNYIRDKTFSHGFAAVLSSADVDKFRTHPSYCKVLEKLEAISDRILTANMTPYKASHK